MEIYHVEIKYIHTDKHKYYLGTVFNVRTINADYRTIPGPNLSIFPSNRSHEKKTCTFSGIFDDHNSQFASINIFYAENS